jgi:hypothetical protein
LRHHGWNVTMKRNKKPFLTHYHWRLECFNHQRDPTKWRDGLKTA